MENNDMNKNIEAYFDSFPSGYRFLPRDQELIVHYLKPKVLNEPLPVNRILDVKLYEYNPEELSGMHRLRRESEWYFFTPRERKYPNGSRPNRSAGNGYWKPTGTDKTIKNGEQVIGYKKSLDFYTGKHPNGTKTNWKMHEYRVEEKSNPPTNKRSGSGDMKLDDWVLCKIYKKAEKKKDKNNEDVEISNEQDSNDVGDGNSGGFTSTTSNYTLANESLEYGTSNYSMQSIPTFNNDITFNNGLEVATPNQMTQYIFQRHVSEEVRTELEPPNNVALVESTFSTEFMEESDNPFIYLQDFSSLDVALDAEVFTEDHIKKR